VTTPWDVLDGAAAHARVWLDTVDSRPVQAAATYDEMLDALGGPLPEAPLEPAAVVDDLVAAMSPGLTAMQSPRFFGFVIGASLPAALAADWLVSAWDQNSGLLAVTPATAAAEAVAAGWLIELLGLPTGCGVGFVTGGCMANATCLAAARHHVLAAAGWDVEDRGLQGAPRVRVIVPDERHATVDSALRYLGLGAGTARRVATDDQGRMLVDDMAAALAEAAGDPTIITVAAGNVNTGAFDPIADVVGLAKAHDAWVHVDGAFGLWAAASPAHHHLVAGLAGADSWATDAHKWLNVPYDCGIAITRHMSTHRAAMGAHAAYLIESEGAPDPVELVPEFSRRARGVPVFAALRSLGRSGIADLVDRCCRHAQRFAAQLDGMDGVSVLNDVVLNQVLVHFDDDETTQDVVDRVLADRTAFMSGTRYKGRAAMRVSVCGWQTTQDDVDATVAATARCLAASRSSRDEADRPA
jgi:glutamate/tyrosine decarboxylase-like PLP-dependent enzyme